MSADRDVNRIVRSWLEEGVTSLPDRVLDTVLDQLPATPQRRAPWPVRRLLDMNIPSRIAVAAAVVIALAAIGALAIPKGGGVAGPQPTSSPRPTATPIALPSDGPLAAASYVTSPFVSPDSAEACMTPPQSGCVETSADDSIRITFTVPDGWEPDPIHYGIWLAGNGNRAPDGASLFFERGGWLYSDPCHSSPPPTIRVGPSADDFANALANDRALTTTAPVAVTLSGYSGKSMDLQIPSDISACTDNYWPWEPGFYAQGPSQRWHLWILDVSGTRVVILTTDYAGTSAANRTALQAIVDSIQIQP
jgi:hypothetical protein